MKKILVVLNKDKFFPKQQNLNIKAFLKIVERISLYLNNQTQIISTEINELIDFCLEE
jgi:hypothetical protein